MKKAFKASIVAVFASLIFISSTSSLSAVKKQSACFTRCELIWEYVYYQCYDNAQDFLFLWECLKEADRLRIECERDCYNA